MLATSLTIAAHSRLAPDFELLQRALNRFLNDADILNALAASQGGIGNSRAVQTFADKLHNLSSRPPSKASPVMSDTFNPVEE